VICYIKQENFIWNYIVLIDGRGTRLGIVKYKDLIQNYVV